MYEKVIKTIIGDIEDKKEYRKLMKRVSNLPKDYEYAFKKIQHYIYNVGVVSADMHVFMNLLEMFEEHATFGTSIQDIIGDDVAEFVNSFVLASNINPNVRKEKLNKEILEYINKENLHGKLH